jgi:drug/metabolite transporter (DMT)-like permease
MGLRFHLPRKALVLSLARALVSVVSTLCFIAALKVMPIADALAIVFVEPFIILFIGRFVMGEQVGPRRIGAALLGFIGALLVIQPAFDKFGLTALLPLGTALSFALYILITRALSRHVHPVAMQFQTAFIAGLMCLPLLALGSFLSEPALMPVLPTGMNLLWCAAVGLAATVSHMSMTFALRLAPSSTLAPLHYLEMAPAVFFAYLVFGDFPDLLTWCGIGVIFASGLYIIHRERITARSAAPGAGLTESP